jgi:hypothetical protein
MQKLAKEQDCSLVRVMLGAVINYYYTLLAARIPAPSLVC